MKKIFSIVGIIIFASILFLIVGNVVENRSTPLVDYRSDMIKTPLQIATERAQKFERETKLLVIFQGRTDTEWVAFFSSRDLKQRYEIIVRDNVVISAKTIKVNFGEISMPTDIVSSESAITRMRWMPGYENVTARGVELMHGFDEKWYWGIETEKGVFTIKAER